MELQLQTVTDTFIEALEADESIQAFQQAQRVFAENRELQGFRERYGTLAEALQRKQMDGTLTQDDIVELRTIQNQVNNHPVTQEYLRTQESATAILGACNQTISETLGFDFSSTAAPATACCG